MDNTKDFIDKHIFQILGGSAITVIFIGTIAFHFIEKWSYLNSYYFSVITLTTVGYGDFTPTTPLGKVFATIYIFIGIGIIATFAQSIVRRRGEKMIKNVEARRERRHERDLDVK